MGAACGGAESVARDGEGEVHAAYPQTRPGLASNKLPELGKATREIDMRVRELESRIQNAEQEAKMWAAKAQTDPTAKARAVRLLKQKRQYEEHRERLMSTQFNVENMQFQEEQAAVTLMAAQAMQDGHERLLKQKEQLGNAQDIERLQEDIQDLAADLGEAQDLMARSGEAAELFAPSADLEAEFFKIQDDLAQEANEQKRMLREAAQAADQTAYAKVRIDAAERDALAQMPMGKLKALARYHGVSLGGCSEKADVLAALQAAGLAGAPQAPAEALQAPAAARLTTGRQPVLA